MDREINESNNDVSPLDARHLDLTPPLSLKAIASFPACVFRARRSVGPRLRNRACSNFPPSWTTPEGEQFDYSRRFSLRNFRRSPPRTIPANRLRFAPTRRCIAQENWSEYCGLLRARARRDGRKCSRAKRLFGFKSLPRLSWHDSAPPAINFDRARKEHLLDWPKSI